MADSDEEFWNPTSASHLPLVPRPNPSDSFDSESESNLNDRSSTRKRSRTAKRTSERGVGTAGTATRKSPPHPYAPPARNSAATPFSPRQFSRTNSSSSSGPDNGLAPLSADSDTENDAADVEASE
ncbi:hypothetical protein K466DRAFT_340831 [Polyporus arcularius HHB13444]|uniref:Uncharacterized protein n=1 Tax=Polyporus arcularius HHB13444 TaxID=1314778 RepID=A0A5C3PN00_9APHY|nr:hypothetical protein K466DRAFT_340831 [Polyporus arcularius HHB13444]